MNLYLITRRVTDYDEHGGFVVAAVDEDDARAVIDEDVRFNGPHPTWSWERSEVECIGTAAPHVVRGVLLEDFNAG